MVKVEIKERVNAFSMVMTGHANFNPGNDIVCASISTLAYTLIGALANTSGIRLTYRDNPGDFYCRVDIVDVSAVPAVSQIFKTVKIGLMQIEKQYPKNILVFVDDTPN